MRYLKLLRWTIETFERLWCFHCWMGRKSQLLVSAAFLSLLRFLLSWSHSTRKKNLRGKIKQTEYKINKVYWVSLLGSFVSARKPRRFPNKRELIRNWLFSFFHIKLCSLIKYKFTLLHTLCRYFHVRYLLYLS